MMIDTPRGAAARTVANPGAPPGQPMKSAVLAHAVAKALAHPQRFYLGVDSSINDLTDLIQGRYNIQLNSGNFYKELEQDSRPILATLNRAHKFVLADDFNAISTRWMDQPPPVLEQLLATARLPFDPMWIETRSRGFLMQSFVRKEERGKYPTLGGVELPDFRCSTDDAWFQVQIFYWKRGDQPVIGAYPMATLFSPTGMKTRAFRNPIESFTQEKTKYRDILHHAFGYDYFRKHKRRYAGLLTDLGDHVHFISMPPGNFHIHTCMEAARYFGHLDDIRVTKAFSDYSDWAVGSVGPGFRFSAAVLAMLSTHIGGGPLLNYRPERAPPVFIRGRYLPAYEFKVVTLTRPMSAPRLLRRAFPPRLAHAEGMRWHEVAGAWHHRRAANAICAQHPRACPTAAWAALYGDDGKRLGADQQACEVCQRKRWRIEQHPRGDKNLGIVEKGFEVRGSRHARLPPDHQQGASA
jgi:hypothetical protein